MASLTSHSQTVLTGRNAFVLESIIQLLDPENAHPPYIEGLCLQALGRNAEAADPLARFLKREPGHADAWFWRASAISKALERSPEWDEALYERGLCHSQSGDRAAAISDFDRVLEQGTPSSHTMEALQMKAGLPESLGESRAAESCAVSARAYVALAEQRYREAIQFLRAALELDAKNAGASFRLAALLIDNGTLEDAEQEMARGLELRPRNAELWSTRGVVLGRLGRRQEALDCYSKALDADPLYAPALRNMGIALLEQDRFQESLDVYDRALAMKS